MLSVLCSFSVLALIGIYFMWILRFLSPLSAVPLVSLVGFGLYEFGFPGVSRNSPHLPCINIHPIMIVEFVSSLFRLPNVLKLGCQS